MRRLGTLSFSLAGRVCSRRSVQCVRLRPAPRLFCSSSSKPDILPTDCSEEVRESFTPEQLDAWTNLPAVEKLKRDPYLFSSNYVEEGEQDSRNLLDDAWVLSPTPHTGTVIWLHGIGEGRDEAKKIFTLMSPPGFRVVVPRAPLTPVTALDEKEYRTWYDLEKANLGDEDEEDYRGISRSYNKVQKLIEGEAKLIDSKKIILAGFAQGGALAIHAGLRCPLPLGGILSHSGYVALPDEYPQNISEANRKTRICAVHGRLDEVVPLEFAKSRYRVLEKAGLDVELRVEFSLAHHSSEQSLFEMQRWFEDAVSGKLTKLPKRL